MTMLATHSLSCTIRGLLIQLLTATALNFQLPWACLLPSRTDHLVPLAAFLPLRDSLMVVRCLHHSSLSAAATSQDVQDCGMA